MPATGDSDEAEQKQLNMAEIVSEAMIYLSGQRGCTQSRGFRSFHTFNFGAYQNHHREPYGSLKAFNDETLGEKCSVIHTITEDTVILLLPVVGGIEYSVKDSNASFLDAGECHLISLSRGSTLKLSNPYKTELVNYICGWLSPEFIPTDVNTQSVFDLDTARNSLVKLFSVRNVEARVGKFSGRMECTYSLQNYSAGLFAFVIEGAFEFQNRLLEQRDGLLLLNVQEVEFESLSDDAVVLILEI